MNLTAAHTEKCVGEDCRHNTFIHREHAVVCVLKTDAEFGFVETSTEVSQRLSSPETQCQTEAKEKQTLRPPGLPPGSRW